MGEYLDLNEYQEIANEIDLNLFTDKTFLITGASGFLAKNIIGFLLYLKRNVDISCGITALSHNLDKAGKIYQQEIKDGIIQLVKWDYRDPVLIDEDVDYIFHTSSPATTSYSYSHPVDTLQVNAIGTWRVLELCKIQKVKGMLFFSSGAVHGDIQYTFGEITEEDIFSLDFLSEKNFYPEAKRFCEALCRAYSVQYGINAKVARISHTYGPGIDINDGRVFSDFVKDIIYHRDLNIKGDGTDFRPFLYVADAVKAFFYILFYGESGLPYSVANSCQVYTIKELADILTIHAFPERNLKVIGNHISDDSVVKCRLNTDRLFALGWKPKIDVIEGFRRTVKSIEKEDKEHETYK